MSGTFALRTGHVTIRHMEPSSGSTSTHARRGVMHYVYVAWLTGLYVADRFLDWTLEHVAVVRREFDLFLGIALAGSGILSFKVGRYCDGNSADYLSCTRPAVFYYYPAFDTALIVLGIFLIVLWVLARRRA